MDLSMLVLSALAGCGRGPTKQGIGAEDAPGEKRAAWQPGDDIPGWEGLDVECPLAESAGQAVVALPDVVHGTFGIAYLDDGPFVEAFIELADYSDTEDGSVITYPGAGPYVDVDARDYAAESITWRTGWFGQDTERPDSNVIAAVSAPVGGTNTDWGDEVLLCLSRVRPDEMRGVVYVIYHYNTLAWLHYNKAIVEYSFEAFFDGSSDASYELTTPPTDDFWDHSFAYGIDANYDEIWDWDAITDPVIRDTVYERYKPYNWP